jgi:hypothetical protein
MIDAMPLSPNFIFNFARSRRASQGSILPRGISLDLARQAMYMSWAKTSIFKNFAR